MGSLVGHVLPGIAFLLLGLWHLFNHIKLHSLNRISYTSSPWFPTSKFRYLELIFIMVGSSISISTELFIGPAKHQPFDTDGTIPSNHLRNFEHSSISMTFFTYAAFAMVLDKSSSKSKYGLTMFLGAIAFAQELLLFYFHSTDHIGVEGQYHLLLQSVILVSLATTLLGIGHPKSFIVSFIRSVSIFYQGAWFIVIGYMFYTPQLIPKGCFLHDNDGHKEVNCSTDEALHRAKSLINIQFSWVLIAVAIFSVVLYVGLVGLYGEKVAYSTLPTEEDKDIEKEFSDVESEKERKNAWRAPKLPYAVMDIER